MNLISRLRAISPWAYIAAIILAWLFFGVSLAVVLLTRPQPQAAAAGTAVLKILYAPTDTSIPPTPTITPSPTSLPPEGTIYTGGFVQVTGTGGTGLRLRFEPGLEGQVRLLAGDGEVFQVGDGPLQADGYTWWFVQNPQDQDRRGWAVADFLQAIPQP